MERVVRIAESDYKAIMQLGTDFEDSVEVVYDIIPDKQQRGVGDQSDVRNTEISRAASGGQKGIRSQGSPR
jgi:hypothetical protein